MRRSLARAVLGGIMALLSRGCNLFDSHVRQMDLLRGMAADVAGRLDEGAVAQISGSGQMLNPGVTIEAAIVYRATARFDGLAGQYSIASAGTLGERRFPDEVMAVINDASLTNERRVELIVKLLRNR